MTKKEPKEKRMQAIIEAAVEVFLEKGFEAASMETIAKRAGLTKGGLYHHFKGKDEILFYANDHFMEPVLEMMGKCRQNQSPTQGLREFIWDFLYHWDKHADEVAISLISMTKIVSDRKMWPPIEAYTTKMIFFFESMLELGINAGEIRSHDTYSRAWTLLAALDGITGYMIMNSNLTPGTIAESLEKVLLDEILIHNK